MLSGMLDSLFPSKYLVKTALVRRYEIQSCIYSSINVVQILKIWEVAFKRCEEIVFKGSKHVVSIEL